MMVSFGYTLQFQQMKIMICKVGFECVPSKYNGCVNQDACNDWTKAWQLPYTIKNNEFRVGFSDSYDDRFDSEHNEILGGYDWAKYFAEYGYAESLPLPYTYRKTDNSQVRYMHVNTNRVQLKTEFQRQELKGAGWCNASALPYYRKNFFVSDYLDDDDVACAGIKVSYRLASGLTDDERCKILDAGYAQAIQINNDDFRTDGFLLCQ